HALWDASFDRELRDPDRRQRALLCRLQYDRVPGRKYWTQLPRRHHQREVPRHNSTNNTKRLPSNQGHSIACRGRHLVIDLVDRLAKPAHTVGGSRHINREAVTNRLPDVQRFEKGKLLNILFKNLRKTD